MLPIKPSTQPPTKHEQEYNDRSVVSAFTFYLVKRE